VLYEKLVAKWFSYTKKHLTCSALIDVMLRVTGNENASRVLLLGDKGKNTLVRAALW
jgi:hypothetical protein